MVWGLVHVGINECCVAVGEEGRGGERRGEEGTGIMGTVVTVWMFMG